MRRGKFLIILTALFVVGGLLCFVQSGRALVRLRESYIPAAAGAVLLLLAATAGLFAVVVVRRSVRDLDLRLRELTGSGKFAMLAATDEQLVPLASRINELVEYAERRVTDAAMRLKELEIQLKVATAQRQHAQAIIYSISDAVLVTDPFDELVLANESAARTFDFDLQQASRLPVDQRAE